MRKMNSWMHSSSSIRIAVTIAMGIGLLLTIAVGYVLGIGIVWACQLIKNF